MGTKEDSQLVPIFPSWKMQKIVIPLLKSGEKGEAVAFEEKVELMFRLSVLRGWWSTGKILTFSLKYETQGSMQMKKSVFPQVAVK